MHSQEVHMKKYSFIGWILLFVLVLGGGYYFINEFGSAENPQDIVDNAYQEKEQEESPNAPTEGEEVEEETPTPDRIDRLRVKTPFSPEFTVFNQDHEEVSLADYKGKKVILNFWASWCPPCVYEMPEFQAFHEEVDEEEMILLAVNLTDGQRETRKMADDFLVEHNLSLNVLYDTTGSAFFAFKVDSIPQTFFIDEEGMVQFVIMGMTDRETLDAVVERMD